MFLRPKFIYRKHLAPHIWGDDKHMRSDVRVAILTVIDRILQEVKSTGIPFDKSDIRDIFVHGSITNYYYNKNSDIDVCVVCDFTRVSHALPAVNYVALLKLFSKSINFQYAPRVCGHKLDIVFADINWSQNKRGMHRGGGGMYSIIKNVWLRDTVKIAKKELQQMRREAKKIYTKHIADFKWLLNKETRADIVDKYVDTLYSEHNKECDERCIQPINARSIAFRMVRSSGLINRARERALKLRAAGKK